MRLNSTVDPRDQARLSRQCLAILKRLREGPATSAELAGIALKYTGRISDLRRNGFAISSKRDGGGFLYTLLES
jgi:hypothetical protein